MNLKQIEANALGWLADELAANTTTIEADLGPIEVVAVNDGLKLADEAFAKLPFGVGALVDIAFAKYAPVLEGDASKYVGTGLVAVVTFLRAAEAHVLAS